MHTRRERVVGSCEEEDDTRGRLTSHPGGSCNQPDAHRWWLILAGVSPHFLLGPFPSRRVRSPACRTFFEPSVRRLRVSFETFERAVSWRPSIVNKMRVSQLEARTPSKLDLKVDSKIARGARQQETQVRYQRILQSGGLCSSTAAASWKLWSPAWPFILGG